MSDKDTWQRTFPKPTIRGVKRAIQNIHPRYLNSVEGIAFIGILSALMALQLERTRELGTLRAAGMTLPQLWRLTLLETGLMGATAGLLAMPTGLALSAVLIYVINLRSFGWTIFFSPVPEVYLQALIVSVFAALCAGVYPLWRMGKLEVAAALRSE